jgi:hypothetical protein
MACLTRKKHAGRRVIWRFKGTGKLRTGIFLSDANKELSWFSEGSYAIFDLKTRALYLDVDPHHVTLDAIHPKPVF